MFPNAGKNTHDESGFGTQQPRENDSEEEDLIPLGDGNGKESPQQIDGERRNIITG